MARERGQSAPKTIELILLGLGGVCKMTRGIDRGVAIKVSGVQQLIRCVNNGSIVLERKSGFV